MTGVLDAPMAPDRVRKSLHAHSETADVIANLNRFLVGADALGHHHANRLQPPGECPRSEARVDEHATPAALNQNRIPAAPAAQHPELHSLTGHRAA